jgi:hypothetical protein
MVEGVAAGGLDDGVGGVGGVGCFAGNGVSKDAWEVYSSTYVQMGHSSRMSWKWVAENWMRVSAVRWRMMRRWSASVRGRWCGVGIMDMLIWLIAVVDGERSKWM